MDENEPATINLDELCRVAAQEMLAIALAAERMTYLEADSDELDVTGEHLVVGNSYARPGEVTTGSGSVEMKTRQRRPGRRGSRATAGRYERSTGQFGNQPGNRHPCREHLVGVDDLLQQGSVSTRTISSFDIYSTLQQILR